MEKPPHLDDFLGYMAAHMKIRPLHRFEVTAGRRPDRPLHPNFLPRGEVVVLPEFLVFLTTKGGGEGWGKFGSAMGSAIAGQLLSTYRLYKWAVDPEIVLKEVGLLLKGRVFRTQDMAIEALVCENSFFVPLNLLRSIERDNDFLSGCSIRLVTSESSYVLCMDPTEPLRKLFTPLWITNGVAAVSGRWKAGLVTFLQERARANAIQIAAGVEDQRQGQDRQHLAPSPAGGRS